MKRNYFIVLLVFLIFFVISLLTNILGPLTPDIIASFNLNLGLAGFLPFSFFLAYGFMSIPAGILVEKYREKTVIVLSFVAAFIGSLLFSVFPYFPVALVSLFLIGIGMAMLQVAINPLLRVAGGEEHFAFNSVAAQLIFGLASFISPQIYSYLVSHLKNNPSGDNALIKALSGITPANLPWISLYYLFVIVTLFMVIINVFIRLPKVELKEDERAGALKTHLELLKDRQVILYFFAIFAYVGTEQGVANWLSKFLDIYHGYNPQTAGANAVSLFWGLMTAGCLVGLLLLKLLDSRKVLIGASLTSVTCLSAALFGPASVAITAFPMIGFFISVMWSIIFSLALNSVSKHHGSFSGILCTAILGGAVLSLAIGALGDSLGLRQGMILLYLPLAYILSVGFWAKPLISNATVFDGKAKKNIPPATSPGSANATK